MFYIAVGGVLVFVISESVIDYHTGSREDANNWACRFTKYCCHGCFTAQVAVRNGRSIRSRPWYTYAQATHNITGCWRLLIVRIIGDGAIPKFSRLLSPRPSLFLEINLISIRLSWGGDLLIKSLDSAKVGRADQSIPDGEELCTIDLQVKAQR